MRQKCPLAKKKAVTRHQQGNPFDKDIWELYQVEKDFAEIHNLASTEPEKLQALIKIWFEEAERYDILPMEDDTIKLYAAAVPPPKARHYFFPGMTRLDRLSAPDIFQYNSHWKVAVDFDTDHANGVILASGDSGAGYELYMKDGFIIFSYTYVRKDITVIQSNQRIPEGQHTIEMRLDKTGKRTATVSFTLNNRPIGKGDLPRMWEIYTPNSGLRCGENRHAPISRDYSPPFVLEGLKKVIIDVALS